jgi:prepilin-type N-terminal cleavage/methylation domain-containing protein
MKKDSTLRNGFTLVELLVVIGVFATVSSIIVLILFSTLRASKKSDTLIELKQNGNSAISQISKSVRYAKSLDNPDQCSPSVVVNSRKITSVQDDAQTTYACVGGSSPTIASNGASLIGTDDIRVSSCIFMCTQSNPNDPPVISLNFTLTSKNSGGGIESSGSVPFKTSIIMRNYNR